MKVGYLGPGKSTFGYAAAEQFFNGNNDVELIPFSSHTDICLAAGKGDISYGMVAIENVIEGLVTETVYPIDRYSRRYRLLVSGEVEIPVKLFLLRHAENGVAPTKILAHTVAQRQCSKRLEALQKEYSILVGPAKSNGDAAEKASKDPSAIAVSTATAEEEYGLIRLEADSITNNPNNFTRFWIVGTQAAQPSGRDKTCFLLNLDQPIPGGISKALAPFASRGINLLVMNPIPIPGRKWEYSWMLEFSGSISDPNMEAAYEELCASGISMDAPLVLGSYPAGTKK